MNRSKIKRNFDMILNSKNYAECPDRAGIYLLYHIHGGKTGYLYVGASVKLNKRAVRFFTSADNDKENFYLRTMINALPKNELLVGVKFSNQLDIDVLAQEEKNMRRLFNPIFNVSNGRYCKTNHTTVTA